MLTVVEVDACRFPKLVSFVPAVLCIPAIYTVFRKKHRESVSCVRKHLQQVVCFILVIYLRPFNNNVISNGKHKWVFFLNTVYIPCKTFQHIGFAL